jgi:vitamin B12 transporter
MYRLAILSLFIAPAAHAADSDIIVTATGVPQDRDEAGQAISIIDAATIDTRQVPALADLLATTPSVRINANGPVGSVTGVSLRGASTAQTLVLVDGVRVNDPSSTSDAVDFGNLLLANIRRIELLRGPNSLAYGSQAIGGVVAVSTERQPGDGAVRASASHGYADTIDARAALDLGNDRLSGGGGIAWYRSDGISSAAGGSERDGVDSLTANARVKARLGDGLTLDLRGYHVRSDIDYDSFFAGPADSPDESRFRQWTGYAGVDVAAADGLLTGTASLTGYSSARDYYFSPDSPEPDFGYRGRSWRGEWRGVLRPASRAKIVFGYSHDAPRYRFFGFGSDETHRATIDGAYALAVVTPLPSLSVTGGVRRDWHSRFGGATTFGANLNWGLFGGGTRLRAAYGEGYKAPSLYQLFDSYSGNRALRPERSRGYDIGLDQRLLGGRATLSVSLYTRSTRDQIDYDFSTFSYANTARGRARGAELSLELRPTDRLRVSGSYSYVDARDRSPGASFNVPLPRRAAHGASLSIDQDWAFGLSTGATLTLVGDSRDPLAPDGRLGGYAILGLRASVPVTRRIELFGRVDNVTDTDYATTYGYGSYGRSAYAGARLRW